MSPDSVLPFEPKDFSRSITETREYIAKNSPHLDQGGRDREFEAMVGRKYVAGSLLHKSFTLRYEAWAQALMSPRFSRLAMQHGDVRVLQLSQLVAAVHPLEDDTSFSSPLFFAELERKL